jgi:transposase
MNQDSQKTSVVGIDQGDVWSHLCELDPRGEVVRRERIRTTRLAYAKRLGGARKHQVVLEVGPHSPWSSRWLTAQGHEVIVANPRRVRLIAQAERKTDRVDAETLARLGRADPALLAPIRHGGESFQRDRALLTVREGLVRSRARLVLQARGLTKSMGERLPPSSTPAFPRRVRETGLGDLLPGLSVLLDTVEGLSQQVRRLDQEIEQACRKRYPQTQLLRQVPGVGPITALAYVLKVEDPSRFPKSRDAGPFFALVPRERSSGNHRPQLGIPPRGDAMVRRLLIQAAQYILGRFGPDSDLRRFGLAAAERTGSPQGKKRAVVAVARKLAVLLHRLWVTGEVYRPFREEIAQTP